MRMRRSESDKAEVAMSPFIDAVFLLLIFFLVATMLKKQDKDIDIVPPESSSAVKMMPDDDVIVLGINAQGELFWDGRPTTANLFHHRLKDVWLANPAQRLRLDADAQTPFHRVAEVLDGCQFRGLSNVGIRTYDDKYNQR